MLSIGSSILHLLADVVDQRGVLVLDALDDGLELGLHLLKVVAGHLVTELVVSMNAVLVTKGHMAAQELDLLERYDANLFSVVIVQNFSTKQQENNEKR